MKRWVAVATVAALCFGTSARAGRAGHIHDDVDPYTGDRTISVQVDTGRCAMSTSPDGNPAHVRLIVSATQSPHAPPVYVLLVDMTDGHWIHPGKNSSMQTLADGVHDQLYPIAEKTKWREHSAFSGHRYDREQIPFGIDRDFLKSLVAAKAFQFRIDAADTTLERCTDAKALRDLPQFLSMSANF